MKLNLFVRFIVTTFVACSCIANADIYLNVNGSNPSDNAEYLNADEPVTLGLAGSAELISNKYDLTISVTGGQFQNLSKKSKLTDTVSFLTDDPNSVGEYLLIPSGNTEVVEIELITNTDMIIDGLDASAGTTIYKVVFFYLTETDQIAVLAVDYNALSYTSSAQEATALLSLDSSSESMVMSASTSWQIEAVDIMSRSEESIQYVKFESNKLEDPLWFDDTQECPDFDDDDLVNLKDFSVLANNWMQTGERQQGDFNYDGIVDANDLMHFCDYWLTYVDCPGNEFPYITSFEEYQEFELGTIYSNESVNNWLAEDGSCCISQATYYQSSVSEFDYQYAEISSGSTFSRVFAGVDDTNNSFVRISCIPNTNSTINLIYEDQLVASVCFSDSNDIHVLTDVNGEFSYANSNVHYSDIADQCRTFLNNTNPGLTGYSYENSWVELEFRFDWDNGTYDVYWEHYNGSGLIADDAVFDSNSIEPLFDTVEFVNASTQNTYFKLNRISVSDESNTGGVFGYSNDMYIQNPSSDNELSGNYKITGNLWYDKLGKYEVKICQTSLDPNEITELDGETIDNWLFVCDGDNVAIDGSLGELDTGNYFNGNYYMRIFVYDDLGRLLNPLDDPNDSGVWQIGVKTNQLYYNGQNNTQLAEYTISGKLKGQGYTYEEKPEVQIKWPGSFPFEYKRTYDSSLRNQLRPLFFGWTHNHNIRIYESTQSYFETVVDVNDLTIPDKDGEGLGVGKLFLLTPLGGRLFEGEVSSSNPSVVVYTPTDNEPDYIERTSSLSASTFDVDYTYYGPDGMIYYFDADSNNNPYTPLSSEGLVNWMIYKGIDYQEDRFGNRLTYQWDTTGVFVERISNNCNSMEIVFNIDYLPNWLSGPELCQAVGVYNGTTTTWHYGYDLYDFLCYYMYDESDRTSVSDYHYNIEDQQINLRDQPDLAYDAEHPHYFQATLANDLYYDEDGVLKEKDSMIDFETNASIRTFEHAPLWKEKNKYVYTDQGGQIKETKNCVGIHSRPEHDSWYRKTVTYRNTEGAVLNILNSTQYPDPNLPDFYFENFWHWPGQSFGGIVGGGGYIDVAYLYEDDSFPLKPTSMTEFFDEDADGNYDGSERLTTMEYDSRGNLIEKRQYIDNTSFLLTQYEYHPEYNFPVSMVSWQDYCTDSDGAGSISRIESQWIYGDADGTVNANGDYLVCERELLDSNGTEATSDDVWKEVYYTYYSNGKIKTETLPDNNSIGNYYEYNSDGLLTSQWDGIDITGTLPPANTNPQKRFAYDDKCRLVLESDSFGKVQMYCYDQKDNIIEQREYSDIDSSSRTNFNVSFYDTQIFKTLKAHGDHPWRGGYSEITSPYGGKYKVNYYQNKLIHKDCVDDLGAPYRSTETQLIYPDGRAFCNQLFDSLESPLYDYSSYSPFMYYEYGVGGISSSFYIAPYRLHTLTFSSMTYFNYDSMDRLYWKWTTTQGADPYDMGIGSHHYWKETFYNYYANGKKKSERVVNSCVIPKTFLYQDDVIVSRKTESKIEYYYDILDRMTYKIIDPNGVNTIFGYDYDAAGNELYTIDPNEDVTFVDYDNSNRIIRQYHPTETVYLWGLVFDPDLTKETAKLKSEIEYFKDDKVKSICHYDFDGETLLKRTDFEYDNRDRISGVTEYIDGVNTAVTSYEYRDAGDGFTDSRMPDREYHIKITDAENQVTLISLDYDGQLSQILYPDNRYQENERVLEYQWNDIGDVWEVITNEAYETTGIVNGDSNTTTHYRDQYGTVVKTEYPDGGYVEKDYIMPGFGEHQKLWIIRDYRNASDKPSDADQYELRYDGLTNKLAYYSVYNNGKLSYSIKTDWMTAYQNNKKSVKVYCNPSDSEDIPVYNISYSYDSAGRLTSVDNPASNTNCTKVSSFNYDIKGNRKKLTYHLDDSDPNNLIYGLDYTYNVSNYLTGITSFDTNPNDAYNDAAYFFTASEFDSIDGLGRLRTTEELITDSSQNQKSLYFSYSYDMMNQLTGWDAYHWDSGWTLDDTYSYQYQKDGNIHTKTVNSQDTNYEYDTTSGGSVFDSDLMTKAGTDSLDWDENGRLTTGPSSASYVWNWNGKLRSATKGNDSIAVKYDPMGNRVWKQSTVDGVTTDHKYIVDISGELPVVICEVDPNSWSLKKSYIYADSQILSQQDYDVADPNCCNDVFYVHDRLGSVRMVVDYNDITGVVETANSYAYTPFGQFYECSETIDNIWKFTGQWYDPETGQYNMRARIYDPVLMRMTSHDPVSGRHSESLTLHKYLYCVNDPVNQVDLSGEISLQIAEGLRSATQVYAAGLGVAALGAELKDFDLIIAGAAIMELNPLGFAYGYMKSSGLTLVSRWGKPGLGKGDWVMKGRANKVNYFLSGKWQKGYGNEYAPFSSGESFWVNGGDLSVPSGFGGFIKWLFCYQAAYTP